METRYLVQPTVQIGRVFSDLLLSHPPPQEIILVSAFVNYQTIMRLKERILQLAANGTTIRFIIGIDMGGTTLETLRELNSWDIEVTIIKNKRQGHTFHPKLFVIKNERTAVVIIGSHNFTDGGFYKNYECGVLNEFALPEDSDAYHRALDELGRFVNPQGTTAQRLTAGLLDYLTSSGLVPNESTRRHNSRRQRENESNASHDSPFGVEIIPSPARLPSTLIENAIATHRPQRRRRVITTTATHVEGETQLAIGEPEIQPESFFMKLGSMHLDNPRIPGEPRIPLAARDIATDFWGWPEQYEREVSPRGGQERIYWNRRVNWRTYDAENPQDVAIEEVRMYFYENSSDFRFYSGKLIELEARKDDILKITQISSGNVEYECVLAHQGTGIYEEYEQYCVMPVKNQPSRWGYA
jgi:hypothetical protein